MLGAHPHRHEGKGFPAYFPRPAKRANSSACLAARPVPDLTSLVLHFGLSLVFAATLAARIGAPVPASPVLMVAGALAVGGQMSWPAALGVAVLANVLGDGAWFIAGRAFGHRVMKLLCRISMSPDSCVRQSETFIARWGGSSLIAAKFLPGISVVAPPMAGAIGMRWWVFLAFEILAALIWAGLYMGLGALFHREIQGALELLSDMGLAAGVALAAIVMGYLALRWWRRREFLRSVEMSRITVHELRALITSARAPLIIDVRSALGRDIDLRRIPGALGIELAQVVHECRKVARDRLIVTYCNCPNEASAAQAARLLAAQGFTQVKPLAGGLDAWVAAGEGVDEHELAAAGI